MKFYPLLDHFPMSSAALSVWMVGRTHIFPQSSGKYPQLPLEKGEVMWKELPSGPEGGSDTPQPHDMSITQ